MLFGRKTYDMFESFWPKITGDAPTAPNPHAPGVSREMKAMADWINASEKLVFSRTKKDVSWNNSQLFHELDPKAVAALKQKPGPDIMIFGSGSIVSQLTAHGLIDEYQFVVAPVAPRHRPSANRGRIEADDAGAAGGEGLPGWERHAALRSEALTDLAGDGHRCGRGNRGVQLGT